MVAQLLERRDAGEDARLATIHEHAHGLGLEKVAVQPELNVCHLAANNLDLVAERQSVAAC